MIEAKQWCEKHKTSTAHKKISYSKIFDLRSHGQSIRVKYPREHCRWWKNAKLLLYQLIFTFMHLFYVEYRRSWGWRWAVTDVSCAHQRLSDRTQETAALRKARDSSLISAASGKQIQFVGPGDSNLDSEKNWHKHTVGMHCWILIYYHSAFWKYI